MVEKKTCYKLCRDLSQIGLCHIFLASSVFGDELYLEAESGQIEGQCQIEASSIASAGKAVVSSSNSQGVVKIDFKIENGGRYFTALRCLVAEDLPKVGIDGGEMKLSASQKNKKDWMWCLGMGSVELNSGKHTLTVELGKGAGVDRVWITVLPPDRLLPFFLIRPAIPS